MDKQRLLFASVLMAMMSSAALAQTNVTDQYIVNAGLTMVHSLIMRQRGGH